MADFQKKLLDNYSRIVNDLKRINLPLTKRFEFLEELYSIFESLKLAPLYFEERFDHFLRSGLDKSAEYNYDLKKSDRQRLVDKFNQLKFFYYRILSGYPIETMIVIIKTNLFVEKEHKEFIRRTERLRQIPSFTDAYYQLLQEETNDYFDGYSNVQVKIYFFIKWCLLQNHQNLIVNLIKGWSIKKAGRDFFDAVVHVFKDLGRCFEDQEVSVEMLDRGLLLASEIIDVTLEKSCTNIKGPLADRFAKLGEFRSACQQLKVSPYSQRCTEMVKNKVRFTFQQNHGPTLDKLALKPEVYDLLSWVLSAIEYQSYVLSLLPFIRTNDKPDELLCYTQFTEPEVLPKLYRAILAEPHRSVQSKLISKLAANRSNIYVEQVCLPELLSGPNYQIGIELMGENILPSDLDVARKTFLESRDLKAKEHALNILVKIRCDDSIEVLRQALENPKLTKRTAKLVCLNHVSSDKLAETLFCQLTIHKNGRRYHDHSSKLDLIIGAILVQPRETVLRSALLGKDVVYYEILSRLRIADFKYVDSDEFRKLSPGDQLTYYEKILGDQRIETHLESNITDSNVKRELWKLGETIAARDIIKRTDQLRHPESENEASQRTKTAHEIVMGDISREKILSDIWGRISSQVQKTEKKLQKHDGFYLRLKPELSKQIYPWRFQYYFEVLINIYHNLSSEHCKEVLQFFIQYLQRIDWVQFEEERKKILRSFNEWLQSDVKTIPELIPLIEK